MQALTDIKANAAAMSGILAITRLILVIGNADAFTCRFQRSVGTVAYGVPPRSPRPEMYYDEEKIQRGITKQLNEPYNPEYDEDIAWATRRLFELRLRRDQRLPFKSHEFKLLRRHIARLKQQKRADELRASGHDFRKRKPRTRRERRRALEARLTDEKRRAYNRARLLRSQHRDKANLEEGHSL